MHQTAQVHDRREHLMIQRFSYGLTTMNGIHPEDIRAHADHPFDRVRTGSFIQHHDGLSQTSKHLIRLATGLGSLCHRWNMAWMILHIILLIFQIHEPKRINVGKTPY